MSEPRKTEAITIRLPAGTIARLDKLLGKTRISNAEYMRHAILEKLDADESRS